MSHESRHLVTGPVRARLGQHAGLHRLRRSLRADLRVADMIYLAAVVTGLLFVYLGVALVRPEWF